MRYSTLTLSISLLALASPILSAPASPMASECGEYTPCRRISPLFRNERKIFFVSDSSRFSIKNHSPNSSPKPPPPQGLRSANSASNAEGHFSPDASAGTIKESPPSSFLADGVMPAELSLGETRCPYGAPDQGQRQMFSYRYSYTTTSRDTHADYVILGIIAFIVLVVILAAFMDAVCLMAYEMVKWRSVLLRVDDEEAPPKYSDVDEKTGVEGELQRSYSPSPESW